MTKNADHDADGGPMSVRLSRRDYFAAAALAGNLEQGVEDNMACSWWHTPARIAARAYEIADAMLERSRK